MPEKLTLNDGTVVTGHAQETEDRLFLYMYGLTMEEAFDLVKDPEKTIRIVEERFGEEVVHEGFGHLYTVTEERGGMVSAGLKRGGT